MTFRVDPYEPAIAIRPAPMKSRLAVDPRPCLGPGGTDGGVIGLGCILHHLLLGEGRRSFQNAPAVIRQIAGIQEQPDMLLMERDDQADFGACGTEPVDFLH